jgi:hypothetical protein
MEFVYSTNQRAGYRVLRKLLQDSSSFEQTNKPNQKKKSQVASRIFSVAVCSFALLVVAIYTANLASFLIVRSQPSITFVTIGEASQLNKKICTLWGSASSEFLDKAGIPFIGTQSTDDDFIGLDDGTCDVSLVSADTWHTMRNNKDLNPGCNKEWIGRTVSRREGGFSMLDSSADCKSLLRDVFEYYMIQMKLDGTFDEIWNEFSKYTPGSQDCDAAEANGDADDTSSLQLGLESMGGVFIIHLCTMALTLGIACCIYFFKTRWGKYKRTAEDNTNSLEKEEKFGEDNEAITTPTIKVEQEEDIVFMPEEGPAPGLDIFGMNFVTPSSLRSRRGRPLMNNTAGEEAKLEKRLQEHTRRIEELLDDRLGRFLEQFETAVSPSTSKVDEKSKEIRPPPIRANSREASVGLFGRNQLLMKEQNIDE